MKLRAVLLAAVVLCGATCPATAQKLDPVKWSLTLVGPVAPPGSEVVAQLAARMDPGWYLYSLSTPDGGPIATSITLTTTDDVEGFRIYQPAPTRKFDPNFNLDVETYDKEAIFLIALTLKSGLEPGPRDLTVETRFQACTDAQCLPPRRRSATAVLSVDPSATIASAQIPPGYAEFDPAAPEPEAVAEVPSAGEAEGFGPFLLVAFGFGLAAIFTPCVFPMIPITVSYFLGKSSTTRQQILMQAVLFCLGIIVLFSLLGTIATAALGPFGVVQLGSSPWVNTFIALVFLAFGLSLLGAFEISIPSSLLTRLDRASRKGGALGSLLMGLTFSLAAFACVGPFVGTLLAGSIQSGGARPLLGMLSFASGLAAPFFLLALFPSYLQRLPKSGDWLARVKTVLGFVILAAMLKYISNVDAVMQWNLLTRERFLAGWIILFALPGLYLLGFLRLEGSGSGDKVGLGRLLTGAVFLVFSLSLLPGMFGGRLGEIDAYVPRPSETSNLGPAASSGASTLWMKNDYRAALERARAEGKRVFLNFTGYACTNCHWMKANMFPRPQIAAALGDFILLELYTDGTDDASELNQKLQEDRFSTVAIPYYAIVDADERVLATFPGLTRDPDEFLAFLLSAKTP